LDGSSIQYIHFFSAASSDKDGDLFDFMGGSPRLFDFEGLDGSIPWTFFGFAPTTPVLCALIGFDLFAGFLGIGA
jgi:hypothetical protein